MSALQWQTDIIVVYTLLTSLNIGGSLTTAEKRVFSQQKQTNFAYFHMLSTMILQPGFCKCLNKACIAVSTLQINCFAQRGGQR